jgi:kynurenine formamidase
MASMAAVMSLLTFCSNEGRWGPHDELGTLNLITPAKRVEAATLVRSGRIVSIAHDLSMDRSPANPEPVIHRMHLATSGEPIACLDSVQISTHNFALTHLDAVGHVYVAGRMYNGRRAVDAVLPTGLSACSILAMRDGIFTRGVILDVAATRGVEYLDSDATVSSQDLDEAVSRTGLEVSAGDAVFVRVGLGARGAITGHQEPAKRPGLTAEAVRWLFEHDIAVYSGDCVEQMPGPYPDLPLPLHQIGLVAMGLAILDNPDMEGLVAAASEEGRNDFLFVCSPLRIPGGTGSAVNPLAVF